MNVLDEIQKWYASNCDTEWEHDFGVKIETLDNPGWGVTIDLEGTNLEGKEFQRIKDETSGESWIECYVDDSKFQGFGDPARLEEILRIFLNWAKSQNEDWLKPPPPMSDEERQGYEDKQLFASLNDEVEGEQCKYKDCTNNRIHNSVMCRQHHFEMVTGRSAPESAI
ncbi:MAG: immunity 53 family protein [Acidobacteriota bacterium]|nr:immunity 53 family protein [Acidobacteriota bacterium]